VYFFSESSRDIGLTSRFQWDARDPGARALQRSVLPARSRRNRPRVARSEPGEGPEHRSPIGWMSTVQVIP
jgi:hypothetical protein